MHTNLGIGLDADPESAAGTLDKKFNLSVKWLQKR